MSFSELPADAIRLADSGDLKRRRRRLPSARAGVGLLAVAVLGTDTVVVELWTMSAEALLATGDVGLVPWATLAQTTEAPDVFLRRCRERIDQAPPREQANLAAVTQVLAGMRYNDASMLTILGGRQAMIESPVLIELLEERERETLQGVILDFLSARFGDLPEELAVQIRSIQILDRLHELIRHAGACPDLETFRALLTS